MMCYTPSELYYIQFKEVKILWEPGLDMRAGGCGPDNPNSIDFKIIRIPLGGSF